MTEADGRTFLADIERALQPERLAGDLQRAYAALKQSLDAEPTDPALLCELGRLARRCERPSAAVRCFERITRMPFEPGAAEDYWSLCFGEALNQLGTTLVQMGDLPGAVDAFARALVGYGYGFLRAAEKGSACERSGLALPMYSLPAIEYLVQLDYSSKRVFEFGSGHSTLFWQRLAKEVVAVETARDWYDRLCAELDGKAQLILAEPQRAPDAILAFDAGFDVIVVDGAFSRYDSARSALAKLNEGGFIVLDNSDWYPRAAGLLRSAGLIQVDFAGLRPLRFHCSTTSLFLSRSFDFRARDGSQPAIGIGGLHRRSGWDYGYDEEQQPLGSLAPAPPR